MIMSSMMKVMMRVMMNWMTAMRMRKGNNDYEDDVEPAHHVEQIGKLQKSGHIWVDLNGQVLKARR